MSVYFFLNVVRYSINLCNDVFVKKKTHICSDSFIKKVVTARADVDIFNNTLAVCFLASGPWPVNPNEIQQIEKIFRRRPTLIRWSWFRFCRCLNYILGFIFIFDSLQWKYVFDAGCGTMIFLPYTVWILGVNFRQVSSRKFVSQGRNKNILSPKLWGSVWRPRLLKIVLFDLFLV